jgi:hypothetical protein
MTALPPTLDRFGPELERAISRDLSGRRTRRWTLRGAVVAAAAAAAALGVISSLPSGGPSVVERAAAALASADGGILHYQLSAEQRNADGSVVRWHSETWQLRNAPYTRRQIEVGPDGIRAESVTQGDLNELYDALTGALYVATRQQLVAARMPEIQIVSPSELKKITGSDRVTTAYLMKKGSAGPVKVIATAEGAKRLRDRLAAGDQTPTGVLPDEFRSDILALLHSGRVRETGPVEVNGHAAIRLESPNGKQVYVVDAATYHPIEWTSEGNGGGVTLRYPIYEDLPADAASLELLDLEAQHPDARVVRDAGAYQAAESRLYPHG